MSYKNYIARKCELSNEHPQMSANNLNVTHYSMVTLLTYNDWGSKFFYEENSHNACTFFNFYC